MIISFKTFLQDITVLNNVPVICFKKNNYPLLFFSFLCARLKSTSYELTILDCTQVEFNTIQSQLETSFLGNKIFYWLKDISVLDVAARQHFIDYCASYKGPHQIGFALDVTTSYADHADTLIINLEDKITHDIYAELYQFFYCKPLDTTLFLNTLFKRDQALSLDNACRLLHYQMVLGRRFEDFFTGWLERIIIPDKSLFLVSQNLFAKNQKSFLLTWQSVASDYPDEFWIAFWSEQLWQAINFVIAAQKVGAVEAKKSVSRLPFSFMQKDWRSYSVAELTNAHNFLYSIDYRLKNGSGSFGLDLFYSKFLLSQFS